MSREREAFEKWARSNGYIIDSIDGNYQVASTLNCWVGWQAAKAQAVPEGFAVVPIETLNEALSWANCASSESWSDAQREEIDKHYEVIEKAMVSSCEP